MKHYQFVLSVLLVFGFACANNPYKQTNKVYKKQAKTFGKQLAQYPVMSPDSVNTSFVGTTNFSMRRPSMVILHHTAQNSCDQTLKTFTLERTQVSSHYVVCRTGTIFHMLNDLLRGHHAGVSSWGGVGDLNSNSIGIEIDNNGSEPFSDAQINSLITLLQSLKKTYRIQDKHFIGHADIAPCRKVDPSRYFPWEKLANAGIGIWYDTTNVVVPEQFDAVSALRIIGYNINKPECAIQSYKIHYMPGDTTKIITESDRKIIYSLMQKSL